MVITVDNISQVLMGADHVLCVSHLTHLILVPLLVEGGNYYLHLQMRLSNLPGVTQLVGDRALLLLFHIQMEISPAF